MNPNMQKSTILMIGSDDRLAYLLKRYTEQSNCLTLETPLALTTAEITRLRPAAVVFSSIEQLDAAQTLVESLVTQETSILVCASLSDEVRARELGADTCLIHPLTYEAFWSALSSLYSPQPAH